MIYVFILLILFFILLVLLFIPVIIQMNIHNNGISIKLIILKVIKIKIKEKTTLEKLKKSKVVKDKVPLKIIIEIVNKSLPSINYLASKSKVRIRINGTIGLSAADKTALAIGILNMLLYSMEGLLRNYLKYYSGVYNINPDFSQERLDYSILGEVSVLPAYITVFCFKWLKVFLKYKKYIIRKGGASNAGSSNRRIDENYNG